MKEFEPKAIKKVREYQTHHERERIKKQVDTHRLSEIREVLDLYLDNKEAVDTHNNEELELSEEDALLFDVKKENMGKLGVYRGIFREKRKLEKDKKTLSQYLSTLQEERGIYDEEVSEVLFKIKEKEQVVKKELEDLLRSNPEVWYTHHLIELRGYRRALLNKKLIETPYVQQNKEKIRNHVYHAEPVFLAGHLGAGKSELAFQVARETYTDINPEQGEKEPFYRISGDESITRADFFGRYVLKGSQRDDGDLKKIQVEARKKFESWKEENTEKTAEDQARQWDLILYEVRNKLDKGNTTEFEYGPVHKAMEEGKVVVIDEVNAIPHETLISLNDILSSVRSTSGKNTIRVSYNGGELITVRPGFGIIVTGNLNTQSVGHYNVGRQEMDPAFLSRFKVIDYDYVPQKTEGGPDEAGVEDELFHIFLAKIMDRWGNIKAPAGTPEKLWELAKAVRALQDSFSGKRAFEYEEEEYYLEKNVPSLRALMPVLDAWKREDFYHTLDYHLKKGFIDGIPEETNDKKFIEQKLKELGNFFQDGYDSPAKQQDLEFIHKEAVVEHAFGAAPEHVYPDESKEHTGNKEHIDTIENSLEDIAEELESLECFVDGR